MLLLNGCCITPKVIRFSASVTGHRKKKPHNTIEPCLSQSSNMFNVFVYLIGVSDLYTYQFFMIFLNHFDSTQTNWIFALKMLGDYENIARTK